MSEQSLGGQTRQSSDDSRQLLPLNAPQRDGNWIAGLCIGLLILAYGVLTIVSAGDVPFASTASEHVLGLPVNRCAGTGWIIAAS